MTVEDLLKTLTEAGMENDAIKKLLSDAIASLEGPAENQVPDEKEEAGKLLGVNF